MPSTNPGDMNQALTAAENDAPNAPLTSRQALEAKGRSLPGRVTGKLRTAINEMVWSGSRRADAAATAGMTDHSLREALRKPHVKAAYLAELDVLRTSERARNIHALTSVRDDSGNAMARVSAVKALEQLSETDTAREGGRAAVMPGFVIINNIVSQPAQQMAHLPRTDPKPLIEHEVVRNGRIERGD